MRDDIPEWLGKPPLRGTDEWTAWLEKWRNYARAELRDSAADDPDFDFGLLTTEERWRVILRLEIQRQIAQGMAGDRAPIPSVRRISDLAHAGVIAWLVGHSVKSQIPDEPFRRATEWSDQRMTPRRRKVAHAVRYGFLAGIGGEPAAPGSSQEEYVAAYEAAWETGNALAIENDPRG